MLTTFFSGALANDLNGMGSIAKRYPVVVQKPVN
jgi:hypothetical protein